MYIGKGKLELEKIEGLRADKVTKQIVPFKKSTKLDDLPPRRKAQANEKLGVGKYS